MSPSLPTTRLGEGLGQPPRTSPRRAGCGGSSGSGRTWETRGEPGARVPGEPGLPQASSGRPHLLSPTRGRRSGGQEAQPSDPMPGMFSHLIFL